MKKTIETVVEVLLVLALSIFSIIVSIILWIGLFFFYLCLFFFYLCLFAIIIAIPLYTLSLFY